MRLLSEFSCLYSGGSTGGGTHEVQELPDVGVLVSTVVTNEHELWELFLCQLVTRSLVTLVNI